VELRHDGEHRFGLPIVETARCNGCGRCEDRCPVIGDSAIIVSPHGEIRLSRGSYVDECRSLGLVFEDKDEGRDQFRLDDAKLPFQAPDRSPARN
jgi:ferredoxin